MHVDLIAFTTFSPRSAALATDERYDPGTDVGASHLSEFAGRACYQSWSRPNPATATNQGYLKHIIELEHYSVLEHGSATFYITGVSRSLTHELVRHRHFSFSQLSQRFVMLKDEPVIPPLFQNDEVATDLIRSYWTVVQRMYVALVERGNELIGDYRNIASTSSAKRVREAARCVLPNMTATSIVVTGNHRTWREFIQKRATPQADAEIRKLAVEVFYRLSEQEPNLYQDMKAVKDRDTMIVVTK